MDLDRSLEFRRRLEASLRLLLDHPTDIAAGLLHHARDSTVRSNQDYQQSRQQDSNQSVENFSVHSDPSRVFTEMDYSLDRLSTLVVRPVLP